MIDNIDRRGFLSGVFGGTVAGGTGLIVKASSDEVARFANGMDERDRVVAALPVVPANSRNARYIVGVAAESVSKGQLVAVQVQGEARLPLRPRTDSFHW